MWVAAVAWYAGGVWYTGGSGSVVRWGWVVCGWQRVQDTGGSGRRVTVAHRWQRVCGTQCVWYVADSGCVVRNVCVARGPQQAYTTLGVGGMWSAVGV